MFAVPVSPTEVVPAAADFVMKIMKIFVAFTFDARVDMSSGMLMPNNSWTLQQARAEQCLISPRSHGILLGEH